MFVRSFIMAGALFTTTAALAAQSVDFNGDPLGAAPRGWTFTMTGKGAPRWTVESDDSAPSKTHVLKRSGRATYPLALKEGTSIQDGFIETSFKPIAGSEDRAGGVVWRATDANNYYVARANALENNVVLYKTVAGTRSSLDIVGRKGAMASRCLSRRANGTSCVWTSRGRASKSPLTRMCCSRSRTARSWMRAWSGCGRRP